MAIVSRCGGVRYDAAHERVTHVVAATAAASRAASELPAVPVLSPLWLVRSVQAGKALNEADVSICYDIFSFVELLGVAGWIWGK